MTAKVPVERLRLDREPPRLADREKHASDEAIIARLYSAGLDELLLSISTSGYLNIEPLVAMNAPDGDGLIVLEGNRRLAALRLLREPELVSKIASAEKVRIAIPDVDDSLRHTFEQVTVYRVATRQEARAFIGFKHINGAAKWSVYAKARFVADWYREGEVSLERIANALGDRHGTVKTDGLRHLRTGAGNQGGPVRHRGPLHPEVQLRPSHRGVFTFAVPGPGTSRSHRNQGRAPGRGTSVMPRRSSDPQAGPDKRLAQTESLDRPTEEAETNRERRERLLREVLEDIRATRPGFRASDNLPREAVYDRDRARAESKAAAEEEGWSPAKSSDET